MILACVCAAGFARQGSAVATLSIFVEPMTREFGWSPQIGVREGIERLVGWVRANRALFD